MRILLPAAIYHVTARGNNHQVVFRAPEDYDQFLRVLLYVKERQPFRLYGYCLMTNHIHLLVQPGEHSLLSAMMQETLSMYARRYNERYGYEGHLWKNRFGSRIITDELYALRVVAYIDLNPVRAQMCAEAQQYAWSSARAHVLGQPDPCLDAYPPLAMALMHQTYRDLLAACGARYIPELELHRSRGRPRKTKKSSDDFSCSSYPRYPQNRQTIF